MLFSGKRFRRVRCENIDNLIRAAGANETVIRFLKSNAPVFSFTRMDEKKVKFVLETEEGKFVHCFTLGEEHEMERRDGTKIKMTYTLEGENTLNQVVKQPDGKVSFFRREFAENNTKMTITNEGTDKQAVIYYEVME